MERTPTRPIKWILTGFFLAVFLYPLLIFPLVILYDLDLLDWTIGTPIETALERYLASLFWLYDHVPIFRKIIESLP